MVGELAKVACKESRGKSWVIQFRAFSFKLIFYVTEQAKSVVEFVV